MTLDAKQLKTAILQMLGEGVEVAAAEDRISVLTPADYPDGDGVCVQVTLTIDGYVVTDAGEADLRLIGTGPGEKAIGPVAAGICRRFGALFDKGRVVARVTDPAEVADACWRVAQASSAIAEASTFHRPPRERERELSELVASSLVGHQLAVERDRPLEGASGHSYKTAIYVPQREAVLEPVGGERAWNVASAVYVEFGDLRGVNGYTLIAVMDDREAKPNEDVERLLRQVGLVARWSDADSWVGELAGDRLV